jgi:hypothetical protein
MNHASNGTDLAQVQEEKPRHKYAHPKGGMNLYDEGNIIPAAFKDYCGKIANKIIKG